MDKIKDIISELYAPLRKRGQGCRKNKYYLYDNNKNRAIITDRII